MAGGLRPRSRPLVSSYAIDDGDRLLLFDSLAVPSEIEELAAGREPVIVGAPVSASDRLPVGVEAFPGKEPNDVVLWMESRRAVIAGLFRLIERERVEVPLWLRGSDRLNVLL